MRSAIRKATLLLAALALAFIASGCDTWGHKEAYFTVPAAPRGGSASVGTAQANLVQSRLESALMEVAQRHRLERNKRVAHVSFAVPDYEDQDLARGGMAVVREDQDGAIKVSLRLTQFGGLLPHGERMFDEVVDLLRARDGIVLTVNRSP